MRCSCRLLAAALFAAVAAFLPAMPPAHAQGGVALQSVRIQVWPEYDQPAALVIISGQVAEGVETPVNLALPLPEGVTVHAVAYTDPASGAPFVADYTEQAGAISFSSPNGLFLVEYYDDSLALDSDRRSYTATWESPYPVEELVWEVQRPAGASDLEIDTGQEIVETFDAAGLATFRVVEGSVEAGEPVSLSFAYTKAGTGLSVDQMQAAPPAGVGGVEPAPPAAESAGPSWPVIVLLLVGGLALVGGGVFWYVQQTRPAPQRARRAPGRAPGDQRSKRFCTNCGEPVSRGDRFCRSCGERV